MDKETDEEKLLNKIKTYSSGLWKPDNIDRTPIKTNSWFQMNLGKNMNKEDKFKYKYNVDKLENVNYKCKQKIILPNAFQKKVLLSWMDSYIDMYNETLKVIHTHLFKTKIQRKTINKCFQLMKEFNTFQYIQEVHKFEEKEQLEQINGKYNSIRIFR